MTDFTLGVNYWPRKKAMYWWSNFDAGEVREEFAIIKEIGLNVVRLFLLWDDFQPEPTSVAKDKLDNLVKVADIAAEYGLGLDVTFFTGHMSGPNWSPRWLLGGPLPPSAHQHSWHLCDHRFARYDNHHWLWSRFQWNQPSIDKNYCLEY